MQATFIIDEADHSAVEDDEEDIKNTVCHKELGLTCKCNCIDCQFVTSDEEETGPNEALPPNPYLYLAEFGICNMCKCNIPTNKLEKHIRNCNVNRECDLCLLYYSDLDVHRPIHNPNDLTKCQACVDFGDFGVSPTELDLKINPQAMTTHLKTCIGEKRRLEEASIDIMSKLSDLTTGKFCCNCFKCGKVFKKSEITNHCKTCCGTEHTTKQQPQAIVVGQDETLQPTNYPCDLCHKVYGTCRSLQKHYRTIHKQTYHRPKPQKPGPQKKRVHTQVTKGKQGRRKRGNLFMLTFKHWFKHMIQGIINGRFTKPLIRTKTVTTSQLFIVQHSKTFIRVNQRKIRIFNPKNRPYLYFKRKNNTNIVTLLKSTTNRCIPSWKRRISKQYVISNESGIIGRYKHGHCVIHLLPNKYKLPTEECALVLLDRPSHMLYERTITTDNTSVNKLRQYMKSRNRFITDCRAVKSLSCSAKYVTKEDMEAIVAGIPIEFIHPDWQALQIAKRFPHLDINDYQMRLWTTAFGLRKFLEIYNSYWDKHLILGKLADIDPYVNHALLALLSPSKKGIIIYGCPGHGKTTTVLKYTKGKAYRMKEGRNCNQFCFSNFTKEDVIWMDDWTKEDIDRHQTMLKQLTDDLGIYVGERKGGSQFYVHTRKVIITTNDDPQSFMETIPGLKRRFDFIHVGTAGVKKSLF